MTSKKTSNNITSNCQQYIILQKDVVKEKIKVHAVKKKIESDFTSLGEYVFKIIEVEKGDIKENKKIKTLIDTIKVQLEDIEETKIGLKGLKKNIFNISKKIKANTKMLIEDLKEILGGQEDESGDTKENKSPNETSLKNNIKTKNGSIKEDSDE